MTIFIMQEDNTPPKEIKPIVKPDFEYLDYLIEETEEK